MIQRSLLRDCGLSIETIVLIKLHSLEVNRTEKVNLCVFFSVRMGLPIVYFKGSQVESSIFYVFLSMKAVVILANSADPNKMHFIWVFTICKSTCVGVSPLQWVYNE